MVHGGDDRPVKVPGVCQTGIHRAGKAFGGVLTADLLHCLQGRDGSVLCKGNGPPQYHRKPLHLGELACVLGFCQCDGLGKMPVKAVAGVVENAGNGIGQHYAGQEGFGVSVGQGDHFACQFAHALGGDTPRLIEHTGCHACGDGAGGRIGVFPLGHRAVELQAMVVQHPHIPAVAAVELGQLAKEAVAFFRIPVELLTAHPFLQRQLGPAHIFLLAPGQTQQKSVAQKGGNLGMGGYRGVFLFLQVIAQKAAGAVLGLDFVPGLVLNGISHRVAHCQTQQTSAIICLIHLATSFRMPKRLPCAKGAVSAS